MTSGHEASAAPHPEAPESASGAAATLHPSFPPGGEGCLEILADRLRVTPGVVGVEVDFDGAMVTVRYQPTRIDPDHLNEFADEIAALFAQRVTQCERRLSADARSGSAASSPATRRTTR